MQKDFIFKGKKIRVELSSDADVSVFNEIFIEKEYRLVEQVIEKSNAAIIDIGAHIGLFSIYASFLNGDIKILAFEPDENNFSLMKENISLNHLKNVTMKSSAVAGKTGERILYVGQDSHNHSLLKLPGVLKEKKVYATDMNKIFSKNLREMGVSNCDLVKMDCEGAEFEILPSLSSEIFSSIGSFFIEYHKFQEEWREEDLSNILRKHNFRVQIFPSRYDGRMGLIWAYRHIFPS